MAALETSAVLPPLYARWMDELLESAVPSETRATCDDCAMCAPEGAAQDNAVYFSPRVKCCSYQPKLPNYLVGRILEDRDFAFTAGLASLQRRIDAGIGVTPLGVDQAETYGLLYRHGLAGFGRADALRCPHYLEEGGGRCGIWRNRNSVCTTWFCKHERGAVGLAFWNCLRDLLITIEGDVSAWCVLESDLGSEPMTAMFPTRGKAGEGALVTAAELDGRVDPESARRVWGHWLGREREFYGLCARRVNPLSWKQVEGVVGPEARIRARLVREAFAALLSEETPARLTAGSFHVVSTAHEGVRVTTYSGSDPLELSSDVLRILPFFDGRPRKTVLDDIEKELGIHVEEDLVRRLSDFQILVEPRKD